MTRDERDAKLIEWWPDRTMTLPLLANLLGYRDGSSVTRSAQRLGLPGRPRGRPVLHKTAADRRAVRATYERTRKRTAKERNRLTDHPAHNRKMDALTAYQEARIAAAMAAPTGPTPVYFRCPGCGGRSDYPEGHSRCRGAA